MNLQKLNPWNWFKHEDGKASSGSHIPVNRTTALNRMASSDTGDDHPVMQIHREIDRLFGDVLNRFGISSELAGFSPGRLFEWPGAEFYRPSIDISGSENSYQISLDVPGLKESDISLEVDDEVLTIKGQKQEEVESKDKQYYRVERNYGEFQRVLSLPDDANTDEIDAKLDDGVLNLTIPRRQLEAKQDVKQIPIN
jgi:HSP20 family protein